MAELEIPELPGRPLLEDRVKNYPKVQWLLDKYADKAYPIIDKHDMEAVLIELLDDMDRWKGAYKTMKINFNNECDSHAADNERYKNRIKQMKDANKDTEIAVLKEENAHLVSELNKQNSPGELKNV